VPLAEGALPTLEPGAWTPDGSHFLLTGRGDGPAAVWAIRETSSLLHKAAHEPTRLTTGPMDTWGAIPSSDGRRVIAFGSHERGELVRLDAKSGQFVPYLGGLAAEQLAFSRDGEWIAYVAHRAGTLWRSRTDGTERLQLTFAPLQAAGPRWSPDGTRIVFSGQETEKPWNLHVISAAGGAARVIHPEQHDQLDADWLPGTELLVFGGTPWTAEKLGIRAIDVASGELSQLPGSKGLFSPRPAPDGRSVAALSADSHKLLLYDRREERWDRIMSAPVVAWPCWSGDSGRLYLQRADEKGTEIVRLDVRAGEVSPVVDLHQFRQTGSYGLWFGLTPDESPLLLRASGSTEIYSFDWLGQ
jgi:dipeptidyl aminopeptidase/acylaminoacyl peptidase